MRQLLNLNLPAHAEHRGMLFAPQECSRRALNQ